VEGNVYKLARRVKELSGLIKSSCRSFALYTEDGDKKERMFGLLIENEMRMKVCPCNETPGDYSYHLIRSKKRYFTSRLIIEIEMMVILNTLSFPPQRETLSILE
jgi:hypothetical protein